MGFIEKQKECNRKKRIVLLHSGGCNSILLLHSWEIELSIRHHVTKMNQLHDLTLTRYYIILIIPMVNICPVNLYTPKFEILDKNEILTKLLFQAIF